MRYIGHNPSLEFVFQNMCGACAVHVLQQLSVDFDNFTIHANCLLVKRFCGVKKSLSFPGALQVTHLYKSFE